MRTAVVAWVVAAIFYFYQYVLRSAPSVMMPQLSEAFGLSALGVASIVGLFYYGYSPFSLVAGAAMDRLGPRSVLPIGAAVVGVGALLFATGRSDWASVGRVTPGSWRSICACGSHLHRDQELSGLAGRDLDRRYPDVRHGGRIGRAVCRWANDRRRDRLGPFLDLVWALSVWRWVPFSLLSYQKKREPEQSVSGLRSTTDAFYTVFKNPQSILCGANCGSAFHSNDDLRHDMGRTLPPGSAWLRLCLSGHALGNRSIWVDHWLPACSASFPTGSGDESQ